MMRGTFTLVVALVAGVLLGALPLVYYRFGAAHHAGPGHDHGSAVATAQPHDDPHHHDHAHAHDGHVR